MFSKILPIFKGGYHRGVILQSSGLTWFFSGKEEEESLEGHSYIPVLDELNLEPPSSPSQTLVTWQLALVTIKISPFGNIPHPN
ncbi:hypothetical protein CK203_072336 [Vitis vinifera]|uniref:Uncharacterized protein n=1 Tax=Vitis vinifera TaxID=29760 RepID=A0A438E7Y1_VITVI|nr:hypothetical protein CK203_072336 [Vitis vinifera]